MSSIHEHKRDNDMAQSHHNNLHESMHDEMVKHATLGHKVGTTMDHHKAYLQTSSSAPFLFQYWSLQSIEGLLAALLITAAMSVLREVIAHSLHTEEKLMGRDLSFGGFSKRIRRTVQHMLNTSIASTLMLCVMTFNLWLLVVTILGSGLGYFVFFPIIQWAYTRAAIAKRQQTTNTSAASKDSKQTVSLIKCSPITDDIPEGSPKHNGTSDKIRFENQRPLLGD